MFQLAAMVLIAAWSMGGDKPDTSGVQPAGVEGDDGVKPSSPEAPEAVVEKTKRGPGRPKKNKDA